MKTRAGPTTDGYVLNGAKMWITSAPVADVFVVWAKLKGDDGRDAIRGFIVERGDAGLSTPTIEGKFSLRAWVTGQIVLVDVQVPAARMLPGIIGLAGPVGFLTHPRAGTALGAK